MGADQSSESGYPRPDFQRSNVRWESLIGPWDFLFDDDDVGLLRKWNQHGLPLSTGSDEKRTIQVPFVFQSAASGINERAVHEVLWYERRIEDFRSPEEIESGRRLLLRFGAVDYHARVWLDGLFVGEHSGGHVPFDLDLTEAVQIKSQGPHRLTVRVFDSAFDLTQPRGKQYWGPKSESIFYTPSSGIWQSVWLESVPCIRVADSSHGTILRSHDIKRGQLDCRITAAGRRAGKSYEVEVEATFAGLSIKTERRALPREEDVAVFELDMRLHDQHKESLPAMVLMHAPLTDERYWRDGVALWSPEMPLLYELKIRLYDSEMQILDEVNTMTGMRSIDWTVGDGTFRLNGRPYFQSLLLDQGYWPETLMTPPSNDALKRDIELSKAMGFNGCRKHQKVEDPVFMYWADKLGFLVWGEMANCFNFSLESMKRFDQEWMEMLRRDINHPCIVAWTPVNESWGYPDLGGNAQQRNHVRSLYYMTKTLDPTRPINDNCGWEHVITDLSTFHDYADANGMAERCESLREIIGRGRSMFLGPIYGDYDIKDGGSTHVRGAPVLCTEFGGVNIAKNDDGDDAWGYTTALDAKDLLNRIDDIVMSTVKDGNCCGIVWTQFSDIEQEQNGLFSYDRKEKLPMQDVKAVMEKAALAYLTKRHGK